MCFGGGIFLIKRKGKFRRIGFESRGGKHDTFSL